MYIDPGILRNFSNSDTCLSLRKRQKIKGNLQLYGVYWFVVFVASGRDYFING
jgi:hypothetical protein